VLIPFRQSTGGNTLKQKEKKRRKKKKKDKANEMSFRFFLLIVSWE